MSCRAAHWHVTECDIVYVLVAHLRPQLHLDSVHRQPNIVCSTGRIGACTLHPSRNPFAQAFNPPHESQEKSLTPFKPSPSPPTPPQHPSTTPPAPPNSPSPAPPSQTPPPASTNPSPPPTSPSPSSTAPASTTPSRSPPSSSPC